MDNITDFSQVVKALAGQTFLSDKPCKKCSNKRHEVKAGKGPHIAQYRCGQCLGFVAWISKSELTKLYREG